MKKVLILHFLALLPLLGLCETVEIDNIRYSINTASLTATVVEKSSKYSGDVVIPDNIQVGYDVYAVVEIANGAFSECTELTSITIPNNVITIGFESFKRCEKLKSVTMGTGVTKIGFDAFYDCNNLTRVDIFDIEAWCKIQFNTRNWFGTTYKCNPLYYAHRLFLNGEEVNNLVIPNSITIIYPGAFYSCSSITSVTISNNVTSISAKAFAYCANLSSVLIGDGVIYVGNHAFESCNNLSSVILGNSISSIDVWAFYECNSLMSITIPNSVKTIGYQAFAFSGLTYVAIGSGITSIDQYAFDAPNLINVSISDIAAWCKIEFKDETCNPLHYAHHLYSDGEEIKDLVIPNDVTSISNYAFCGCNNLNSVTMSNSITAIGKGAFSGCTNLTKCEIPDIAVWCKTNIHAESANPLYYAHHLYSEGKEIEDLIIPDDVTTISAYTFPGCSNISSLTIPNSVTTIETSAFSGCSNLNLINIGNSLTSIGRGAFNGCKNLSKVNISDIASWCKINFEEYTCNPLYYAHKLFLEGEEISDMVIPNSVKTISNYAFGACTSLKSVTFPSSLASIGRYAFHECNNIAKCEINDIFSWCNIELEGAESNPLSYARHLYSDGEEVKILTIPDGVTSINKYAFCYCEGLNNIVVPNSVTTIGKNAFRGCNNLTKLIIPNSVTSIDDYAFYYCEKIEFVSIPNSVTCIGNYALYGFRKLESVVSYILEPIDIEKYTFGFFPSSAILYVPQGTLNKYQTTSYWNIFKNIVEGEPSERIGDLTGDSEVDGMDLVALVNVIMGQSAQTSGADLNGDGEVDGMDYVAMVNIIMGTAGSRSTDTAAARAMEQDRHHVTIDMEPLTIAPGKRQELTITLQNADMDVTMVQADLKLPQGLSLTGEYTLGNRNTEQNHQLYMSGQDGQHRLMLASPKNALLSGTEGAILRLTLTADASFQGGDIVLSNMLCASPTLQAARQQQAVLSLGGTNGITDIDATGQAAGKKVYSLSGQRMAAPRKGVNIIGGKKYVVK